MKNPSIPRSRPLLIFNPHARVSFLIKNIIDGFRPCRIEGLDDYEKQLEQNDSIDDCYVALDYNASTTRLDRQKGFVIGTIQEPCNDYVDVWAARSMRPNDNPLGEHSGTPEEYLGRDGPRFDSDSDQERFQHWLNHPLVTGSLDERLWQCYGEDLEGVDCFVFAEDIHSSLLKCLTSFALQGGSVDWNVPVLQDLLRAVKNQKSNVEHKRFQSKLERTRYGHRGQCETYFDSHLAHMIETGPEASIYDKFGYAGCCKNDHYESTEVLSDLRVREEESNTSENDAAWLFVTFSVFLVIALAVAARRMIDGRQQKAPETVANNTQTEDSSITVHSVDWT